MSRVISGLGWLFLLGGILGVAAGLFGLLKATVKGTKLVVCPGCRASNRFFRATENHLCTGCQRMLFFGEGDNAALSAESCPYCSLEILVELDLGEMECPDCGLGLTVGEDGVVADSSGSEPCESCETPLPEGVYFCVGCGKRAARRDAYYALVTRSGGDDDETLVHRAAMGPAGHYHHGIAVWRDIKRRIRNPTSEPGANYYAEPREILHGFTVIFEDFEEALADEALRKRIGKMLPKIDLGYAEMLRRLHDEIEESEETTLPIREALVLKQEHFVNQHNLLLWRLGEDGHPDRTRRAGFRTAPPCIR